MSWRRNDAREGTSPLTADRIRDVTFRPRWRGYSFSEVDEFIDGVADLIDALQVEVKAATARAGKTDELETQLQQILGTVEGMRAQLTPGLAVTPRRTQLATLVEERVRRQAERVGALSAPAEVPMRELRQALLMKHIAAESAVDIVTRPRHAAELSVASAEVVPAEVGPAEGDLRAPVALEDVIRVRFPNENPAPAAAEIGPEPDHAALPLVEPAAAKEQLDIQPAPAASAPVATVWEPSVSGF